MSERPYNETMTEAVAVFHDAKLLQDAVDSLLTHGFDHAELSILASDDAVSKKLSSRKASTSEFEDDPNAPRMSYVPNESLGDAQGAIIAAAAYLPAIVGTVLVASTGGTLLAAIATAVVTGSAGAGIGMALAGMLGSSHARKINEQLMHGGMVLWVRTHDPVHEELAIKLLQENGGDHVHLHNLPPLARLETGIPTRRPALSFGGAV